MAMNVRVEIKTSSQNSSKDYSDRAFRNMMASFKRKVNDCNILEDFKLKQNFESKGQKKRRKAKESFSRRKNSNFDVYKEKEF